MYCSSDVAAIVGICASVVGARSGRGARRVNAPVAAIAVPPAAPTFDAAIAMVGSAVSAVANGSTVSAVTEACLTGSEAAAVEVAATEATGVEATEVMESATKAAEMVKATKQQEPPRLSTRPCWQAQRPNRHEGKPEFLRTMFQRHDSCPFHGRCSAEHPQR